MIDTTYDYIGMPRLVYGEGTEYEGATFVRVCFKCGRFVKADATICFRGDTLAPGPNATCVKCGRTEMLFEGFI